MKIQNAALNSADIMTVHELAIYLKMSDEKIYRMARTRDLPAFRIGKSWRFKKNMIDMWIGKKMDVVCDPVPNLQIDQPEKLLVG
jgi:excisionase family DNA binding protein